jgi:hypothetical protein
MEVEFLSNIRYNLFIKDQEWKDWRPKLRAFWKYWAKAAKLSLALRSLTPLSTAAVWPTPLPSPPYTPPYSTPTAFQNFHPPPTPAAPMDLEFSRKRSFDDDSTMPPSKRAAGSRISGLSVVVPPFGSALPPVLPPPCTVSMSMSMVYPTPSSVSPASSDLPSFSFSGTWEASPYLYDSGVSPPLTPSFDASSPGSPPPEFLESPLWPLSMLLVPLPNTEAAQQVPNQDAEAPQQVPDPSMHYCPPAESEFLYQMDPVPLHDVNLWPNDDNDYYYSYGSYQTFEFRCKRFDCPCQQFELPFQGLELPYQSF